MTKEEFNKIWNAAYPDTILISDLFKLKYSDRWFRIHSLPKSKRYAESDEEWNMLLARQNQIINEILNHNTKVFLVTGEYNWGEQTAYLTDELEVFKPYNFVRLDNLSLFKNNSDDYDKDDIYKPSFAETTWSLHGHDNLLKAIADDEARAFFVSFDKNIIVAPYDGGIDFVVRNNYMKESYKDKYKQWISEREDGL